MELGKSDTTTMFVRSSQVLTRAVTSDVATGILGLVCMLSVARLVIADTSLEFSSPDAVYLQDSIPANAGERIVMYYKTPRGGLQAHWVVVLLNVPYEQMRVTVSDFVQKAFGVESEQEIKSSIQREKKINPSTPKEPLYGNGFVDFYVIGVPMSQGREYRMQSKHYNESWWNNYSKSEWRVIDGNQLFNRPCSLVVVSRTDHSREWTVLHPGIPLPFKLTGETKLVTDREVTIIEKIIMNLDRPFVQYFVPDTGSKPNGVINMMKDIWEAAKGSPPSTSTQSQ